MLRTMTFIIRGESGFYEDGAVVFEKMHEKCGNIIVIQIHNVAVICILNNEVNSIKSLLVIVGYSI